MDEQRRRLYDPARCPNGVRLRLGNVYLAEILLHSYLDSDLEGTGHVDSDTYPAPEFT
jgi:hypothetical protein